MSIHDGTIDAGPFAGLQRRGYRVILADPPWHFRSGVNGRHPSKHYRTMPFNDICALPVADLAHPEGCRLLLWITMPFLHRLPVVLKAWGFRYSTARVWIKLWPSEDELFIYPSSLAKGTGYEVIGNAELLAIGKSGRPPRVVGKKPTSAFFARRRQHSRKPDMIRDEVAKIYAGPRIELFARSGHPEFSSWGDETERFTAAAEVAANDRRMNWLGPKVLVTGNPASPAANPQMTPLNLDTTAVG